MNRDSSTHEGRWLSELRRFLVRASLDPEFRVLARSDPEAAFLGFSLTDEQKSASSDPGKTRALIAAETGGIRAAGGSIEASPLPSPQELSAQCYLRIFPHVVHGEDGQIHVSHSGALDPVVLAVARPIPWSDRLDSPETRAAVDRVREADPATRRQCLLALIETLAGT
jgi:hypothetical protein